MALAPVAYFSDPLEDYPNQFIKFYEQGTTTPLEMATDSGGGTTLAKAEISGGGAVPIGFIKTAGDAIFIPYVDEVYDLWIFPTAAEADANDTSNAIQIADDVSTDQTGFIIPVTDNRYAAIFGSVADMQSLITIDGTAYTPTAGQLVQTANYLDSIPYFSARTGGSDYRVMSLSEYGETPDEQGAAFTIDGFAFVLQSVNGEFDVAQFGAVGDGIQILDAAITTGTTTLTSAGSAPFKSTDVGKSIAVFNAGSGTNSLLTTISAFNGVGSVELSASADTTVSGVAAQFGTDNPVQIHAAIDHIQSIGGGSLKANGGFYNSVKIQLRADNISYNFSSATFYANNVTCLDDLTVTHQVTNVIGIGGTFAPIGDTAAFGGNTNYNALAVVHATNFKWYSPRMDVRDGTRGLSIQTNSAHGTAPFQNLSNIRIYDVGVMGDGNTHDGVDITSSADGPSMIQDVTVKGYVEGCQRGVNNSSGSNSTFHVRTDLDIEVLDASVIGARVQFCKDSELNLRVLDATLDGITINGPENCSGTLRANGSGGSLNDAIQIADNTADTENKFKVFIDTGGSNKWTRGLRAVLNDLSVDGYVSNCVGGVSTAGFKTTFGAMVFKDNTTNVETPTQVKDFWPIPAIDVSGTNPIPVLHTNNLVAANSGDADKTVTPGIDEPNLTWSTELTAIRTCDLLSAGAYIGQEFYVKRSAAGAFNLAITRDGGGVQKNMAANTWSTWIFKAGGWELKAFGSL